MKKIILATIVLLAFIAPAAAQTSFTAKDAAGSTQTFKSFNCSSTICALAVPTDSTGTALGTPTSGSDGVSNSTEGLAVYNFPLVFNGTTWDRWYGDKTSGAWVNIKNSSLVVTGTFWQATQPVSAASGQFVDGSNVTLGAKADAKSTATDTTAITIMQVMKEISAMEQAPASRAVTNAGTFATQGTDAITTWGSGSNTLGAMANYGTSPGAVLVPGVNAYITGATGLAIGSTTSGQTGSLVMGAATAYSPTATTADTWPLSLDTVGNLRTVPQASSGKVSGTANQATGGTSTSLVSAVSSERLYIQAFSCANTGASASLVSFQDGSGGTTLWTTIVPAGGGSNLASAAPMFWTTAGNALYFDPATSSTTVYCSASGYAGN